MTKDKLVGRLLRNPQALRIAFWLCLKHSNERYLTAKEISNGMSALSTVRIKQILKKMHENRLVNRRPRENSKGPGPPPLEYKLEPPIQQLFKKNQSK